MLGLDMTSSLLVFDSCDFFSHKYISYLNHSGKCRSSISTLFLCLGLQKETWSRDDKVEG